MDEHNDEQPNRFPWWILSILGMLISLGAMLMSQQASRQALINMNNVRIQQNMNRSPAVPPGR